MCSSRFCWRSGLVKGPGATHVLCRGCSMWQREALPSVWCWRMRSLTRKPTTSTFGNAWSQEHHSREAPGCPQWRHSESDVPRLSEKTVPPTLQDRKHFLGGQTQTLLARSRTQPAHADSPSAPARPCLQHLPPEASPLYRACQQSPSVAAKGLMGIRTSERPVTPFGMRKAHRNVCRSKGWEEKTGDTRHFL